MAKAVLADDAYELAVRGISRGRRDEREGYEPITLQTNRGGIEMRYYARAGDEDDAEAPTAGVIFVGGAGGGFDTPVRGWLYPRLSGELRDDGLAALRVRYRRANDLPECVLDVLAGIAFLESEGVRRIGLVGHSFGGAVVIQAAAQSELVKACVPMSTQTYGVEPARELGPRCSLLLVHGESDEVLPPRCSQYVYMIASEPKKLVLHPEARHGLDEWSEELPGILRAWLRRELGEGEV